MSRDVKIANMILAMRQMQMSHRALEMFRMDNFGTRYLSENYPHIMAELEELTLGWTLIPKMLLRNASILEAQLAIYYSNLDLGLPVLPEEVTPEQYRTLMNSLLIYLEAEVLPILKKMIEPEPVPLPALEQDEDYQKVVHICGLTESPESENSGPDSEGHKEGWQKTRTRLPME